MKTIIVSHILVHKGSRSRRPFVFYDYIQTSIEFVKRRDLTALTNTLLVPGKAVSQIHILFHDNEKKKESVKRKVKQN